MQQDLGTRRARLHVRAFILYRQYDTPSPVRRRPVCCHYARLMALERFPGILAALQRSPAHSYRSLSNLLLINPLEHGCLQEKITDQMTALALPFHALMYVSNKSRRTIDDRETTVVDETDYLIYGAPLLATLKSSTQAQIISQ